MRASVIPRAEGDDYCLHPAAALPGHRVDLLVDGAAAYPAMLEAIAGATREIYLETYTWESDDTGERFAQALIEKARAGIAVRVVVDAVGSFGMREPMVRAMREAGIQIAEFHPVAPWRRRWGWSVRNHRKVLVVDGLIAFTGGINIGNEYAPKEWGGKGWHDVHARVQGPIVRDIGKEFAQAFRHATAGDKQFEAPIIRRNTPGIAGHARVQMLASGSRRGRSRIRRHYLFAMSRARERIWIQAAYFILDRALRRTLRNAVRRGVDVRLCLPRDSDVPAAAYASRATYARLLRDGVRVYEWLPTMLHAKTICIDGLWCSVGSHNFDWRSLVYNWELAIVIVDRATCTALERRFEADLAHCEAISADNWAKRTFWQRVLERVFYTFRKWL